ncbi:hypothetical protein GDO81_011626 [Engystomops pustulosus]|uniref:C2H2-type domain-containing protein n=1 Tax=Engystomops pustulosus TaxID=76066 RepID=A0AAV7BG24_ENGPU|nr:hypothetical protein GDO81_011626 [Engystomops pustulosus]
MENEERQKSLSLAEEVSTVEETDGKIGITKDDHSNPSQGISEFPHNKRTYSEPCSVSEVKEDNLENPCLSKRLKLETELLIPGKDASTQDCLHGQQHVHDSEVNNAGKDHFDLSPNRAQCIDCSTALTKEGDLNKCTTSNSGEKVGDYENNADKAPEVAAVDTLPSSAAQIETHFQYSYEQFLHSHVVDDCKRKGENKLCQKTVVKKGNNKRAKYGIQKSNPNAKILETPTPLSQGNKDGTGNLQTEVALSESKEELVPAASLLDSCKQKELATSEDSETATNVKSLSKSISKIIAKRKNDRKRYERMCLFRRKNSFGQLKRPIQLMANKDKLEDSMGHLIGNLTPAKTFLEKSEVATYLTDEGVTHLDVVYDVESESTLPPATFKIIRTTQLTEQYACVYCKTVASTKENFILHFWKRHAAQMQFYCQPCGYSCVTRVEFEKHCQNDNHKKGSVLLNCYLCGLDTAKESIFKTHMKSKHKMCFYCSICGIYFKTDDERLHHETSEAHIWAQENRCHTADNMEAKTGPPNECVREGESNPALQAVDIPTQASLEKEVKKTQFQCKKCFYKTRSSTVLTRHIKLRHTHEYHFLCKACNIYTMYKEGMERHIKRSKHIENAKKNNIGLLFDECIERVSFIEPANMHKDGPQEENGDEAQSPSGITAPSPKESYCSKHALSPTDAMRIHTPKRGRPKGNLSISCTHCGLMASSVTNLKVHIRRKHTHQYNYKCKVCNYNTVTKGDMERHCITKKHKTRVEEQELVQQKAEIVVTTDGTKFETSVKKKGNTIAINNEHMYIGTASTPLPNSQKEQPTPTDNPVSTEIKPSTSEPFDKALGDALNLSTRKCMYCEFVGDSASLELHVKKNHMKEFEYYCKACGFCAPTHKDMITHASSEVHKAKLQPPPQSPSTLPSLVENAEFNAEGIPDNTSNESIIVFDQNLQNNKSADQCPVSQLKTDVIIDVSQSTSKSDTTEDGAGVRNSNILKNESLEQTNSITFSVQGNASKEVAAQESFTHEDFKLKDASSSPEKLSEIEVVPEVLSEPSKIASTGSDNQNENIFDSSIVKLNIVGTESQGNERTNRPKIIDLRHKTHELQVVRKKKANGSAQGDANRIRCNDCGFLADGLSGLNVHISMKHPVKEKHFHCLLCGKSFFTESNLHQHLASIGHTKNELASFEERPEGGGTFKCVKCTEPFDSEQSLFIHIKEQHEELLREVNKYIEEDTEQINKEREENQGNMCKYCGKICKSSNSMAFLAHIRTHTGSKPFKCKICNFAAAQLGDARNHVKRHLGMREYKCHICGRRRGGRSKINVLSCASTLHQAARKLPLVNAHL